MKYFDVSGNGFTLRIFYEVKLGVVTITAIQLQSTEYKGTFYPGGTIRVNDVPVLAMSYNSPATHSFYFLSAGETFVSMDTHFGAEPPVSSGKILANKATISVEVTLWRDSDTRFYLSGSEDVDMNAGVVHIGDKAYMPYIANGASWDAYGAYKGNGASFDMFSA